MEKLLETVEAIIFAAGIPLKRSDILNSLPEDVSRKQLNDVIDKLAKKYSGDSGIILDVFNDKVQFASNSKYGEIVSDMLRPVREKELSKILLEVLSLIAYRQPITRGEIEDSRGASADYALSVLLKINMIKTCGYKDAPGKPLLYGTTDDFLKKFELKSIDELPDYDEIMRRLVEYSNYNVQTEGLYRERTISATFDDEQTSQELDKMMDMEEIPEFLKGEDVQRVEGDGEGYIEREAASDIIPERTDDDEDGGELPI